MLKLIKMSYLTIFKKAIEKIGFVFIAVFSLAQVGVAQEHSSARIWNEMVLNGIRGDFARPTVHARNLYHTSLAMYDAFAAYDDINETVFLGKTIGNFTCNFEGVSTPSDIHAARNEAISFAAYRIIEHRFRNSPDINTPVSQVPTLSSVARPS